MNYILILIIILIIFLILQIDKQHIYIIKRRSEGFSNMEIAPKLICGPGMIFNGTECISESLTDKYSLRNIDIIVDNSWYSDVSYF